MARLFGGLFVLSSSEVTRGEVTAGETREVRAELGGTAPGGLEEGESGRGGTELCCGCARGPLELRSLEDAGIAESGVGLGTEEEGMEGVDEAVGRLMEEMVERLVKRGTLIEEATEVLERGGEA